MTLKSIAISAVIALFLALPPAAFSSTWYVNGVNGNDQNDCKSPTTACKTIGHAISLAASGDSISVGAATYTENLTIGISLKIIGSSAAATIIDGGGVSTVVTISSAGAHVTLSKVTIRNGFAINGGGISNSGTLAINGSTISGNSAYTQCVSGCGPQGGGIYNSGALTITQSTISGNSANSQCNAVCMPYGGGILNNGTLTINQSTISGNSAVITYPIGLCGLVCWSRGGGIYNSGTLTVTNSTLSGNETKNHLNFGGQGGGIYNLGPLSVNNSTLSGDNTGTGGGGGISNGASAILAILRNTIVASNLSGGNCSGAITSAGFNLSSDNTCAFSGPGDLKNTDPKLGPLQNNGGPTQTQALLPGSPAIDAGNPNGCTVGSFVLLKTDQRGKPRPDKEDAGGCDMGAFERQSD